MSIKMTITAEFNVINEDDIYYVYDSNKTCIAHSESLNQITSDITSLFEDSLSIDVLVAFGKTPDIKPESLNHEGMQL